MNVKKVDLGLSGYEELFMSEAERKENRLPRMHDLELTQIDNFEGHPFQIKEDEEMNQLVESILEPAPDIIEPLAENAKTEQA